MCAGREVVVAMGNAFWILLYDFAFFPMICLVRSRKKNNILRHSKCGEFRR